VLWAQWGHLHPKTRDHCDTSDMWVRVILSKSTWLKELSRRGRSSRRYSWAAPSMTDARCRHTLLCVVLSLDYVRGTLFHLKFADWFYCPALPSNIENIFVLIKILILPTHNDYFILEMFLLTSRITHMLKVMLCLEMSMLLVAVWRVLVQRTFRHSGQHLPKISSLRSHLHFEIFY